MTKHVIRSLYLAMATVAAASTSWAGPIKHAAQSVANTVGDTVGAVGDTVKGAAQSITGTNDPVATRKEVDATAIATIKAVFAASPTARKLYSEAYGFAVFDARKASLLLATGKGVGVAVRKDSGEHIYMHVASVGVTAGAGVQFYQGLFLFETKERFDSFVNQGWEADATANATFGKDSLEAQAKFTNGMAYYQISDTGIMLQASLAGTKYWKSTELNAL